MSTDPISVPRIDLAPGYSIPRLINGGWQLSQGHHPSAVDRDAAVDLLLELAEAGLTAFDGADIYGGVEEIFGRFVAAWNARHGADGDPHRRIRIHTKCVPDRDLLPRIRPRDLDGIIDRSLRRLGVERLDLVQYCWWDFGIPGHVDAALRLRELQQAGKIELLGVTNYDTEHLRELVDAGVEIAANQVQYSLLDRRPEHELVDFCAPRGIRLLCYGSLAGGLLTPRYRRTAEPREPFPNRSVRKYKLIVDEFGGWALFQELLEALAAIAERHTAQGTPTSAANVATRWVLDRPGTAAAIVGARHAGHLRDNLRVSHLRLDALDHQELDAVLARARDLPGDVFSLERIVGGPHQRIMKSNLNRTGGTLGGI